MVVTMSKSLNLPPDTPADVVKAWTDATLAIMDDPEFKQKRGKIFGSYPQTIGAGAIPIRESATTISPKARKWLADYAKKRYDVDLRT